MAQDAAFSGRRDLVDILSPGRPADEQTDHVFHLVQDEPLISRASTTRSCLRIATMTNLKNS